MKRNNLARLIFLIFSFLLTTQGDSVKVFAQAITDQDLENIKREKEFAEAKKGIAEAEAAELKAKFPDSKSTPLEGKTTVNDGAVIESQMIAYVAMARAANNVAEALKKKRAANITGLAIYNPKEIESLLSYRVTYTQLDLIKQGYCEVLKQAITDAISPNTCPAPAVAELAVAPLAIAKSFLGSFVDLTAFLRTNVEIKGQTFDIDEVSFASEIFRAIRDSEESQITKTKFYYPSMFPPGIDATTQSDLLALLEKVRNLKLVVEKLANDIIENDKTLKKTESRIKELEQAIEVAIAEKRDLKRDLNQLQSIRPLAASTREKIAILISKILKLEALLADDGEESLIKKRRNAVTKKEQTVMDINSLLISNLKNPTMQNPDNLDKTMIKLQLLIQQFDQFISSLIQADKITGINPLTTYIKAEKINSALPDTTGYWLQLKVIKAGGNNRIKTNLLWDIFTGGNRLSHSGGAIVQYILFNKNGEAVASDVLTIYNKYIKSNKVKNLPCKDIDDQNKQECKR